MFYFIIIVVIMIRLLWHICMHIPQELRIRSEGTERHFDSN